MATIFDLGDKMSMTQEEWDKFKKSESYGMYLKLFDITEALWTEIDKIKDHNTRLMFQIENLDYEIHDLKNRVKKLEGN